MAVLLVGCEGCQPADSDPTNEDEDQPIADFSDGPAATFPAGLGPFDSAVKPGHWMTASKSLKSNRVDARGQLESHLYVGSKSPVSGQATRELVFNVRPITLPKGQTRKPDYRILVPSVSHESHKMSLASRFVSSTRTTIFETSAQPFNVLSQEEYFFVVLTSRPERFAKLQVADWIKPLRKEDEFETRAANYHIVIPPLGGVLPIPETMLDLTSTAVIFWDNLSADVLTPDQYNALEDWLHFGGQVIVNGAEASEAIANSPLDRILPIAPASNVELDPEQGEQLLEHWAVASDSTTKAQIALLGSQSGRVAVDGQMSPGSIMVPGTGTLISQSQHGRGRVVQSRFDLLSDWIVNWESYQSFFNGVILARPSREHVLNEGRRTQRHIGTQQTAGAPWMNTRLRIASRDAILRHSLGSEETNLGDNENVAKKQRRQLPLTRIHPISGIGGWNDQSDSVVVSRKVLRDESGIEIPSSDLVVRSLGYYLSILVVLNFVVFRLVGRLEYAWLAVPAIAIIGAIWVARVARLDIGFARSQMEIAILETHPDHHRGHLSRVVSIYNSLSSTYSLQFNTRDAAASPFASDRLNSLPSLVFETDFADGPALRGLTVGSNQTRFVRAEQIVELDGEIYVDGDLLINESRFELLDVYVVEKNDQGEMRVAVVGMTSPQLKKRLRFQAQDVVVLPEDLPLQVTQLMQRFLESSSIPNGTSRLVARIDQSLDGMKILPEANQKKAQTVLLAHLSHQKKITFEKDRNLVSDFRRALGRTDPITDGEGTTIEAEENQ